MQRAGFPRSPQDTRKTQDTPNTRCSRKNTDRLLFRTVFRGKRFFMIDFFRFLCILLQNKES